MNKRDASLKIALSYNASVADLNSRIIGGSTNRQVCIKKVSWGNEETETVFNWGSNAHHAEAPD